MSRGARDTGWVILIGLVALLLATVGSVAWVGAQRACAPTSPDAEGPFYVPGAPARGATGRGLVVAGTVRSARDCAPVPGARLEWWSADPRGRYDEAHRASQLADAAGRYRYETDFPGRYPGRPPHLHLRVSAPGHRVLVTQLYPRADATSGEVSLAVDLVLAQE